MPISLRIFSVFSFVFRAAVSQLDPKYTPGNPPRVVSGDSPDETRIRGFGTLFLGANSLALPLGVLACEVLCKLGRRPAPESKAGESDSE